MGEISDSDGALSAIIAERVREYRLSRGFTVAQLAEVSRLSKGMLSKIENAQASPSLATLGRLSGALGIPVTAFFRGLDEEQDVLHVKADQGIEIQHRGTPEARYELLGRMRAPNDQLEPVLVTVLEPAKEEFPLFQHSGTELIYMLEGEMEYGYGNQRYVLEPGDTLQFGGEVTHGPTALRRLPIRFLSIKAVGASAATR